MEGCYNVFLQEEISQENLSFGTTLEDIGTMFSNTPDVIGYEEVIVEIDSIPEFSLVPVSDVDTTPTEIRTGNNVQFFGFPFEKPFRITVDSPSQIIPSKEKIESIVSISFPDPKGEVIWNPNQSIINFTPTDTNKTTNLELNTCSSCGKTFGSKLEVGNHTCQQVEKRFICEICGKSYRNISVKIRHMHSHTNIRPHICRICHKSFLRKEYLTSHLRVHSGDRPYSCSLCSKTFAYSSAKRSHMKLHRTKPFVCSVCNRNFISADKLKQTTETGTNIYTCERCNNKSEPVPEPSHVPTESINPSSITQKNYVRNLKCDFCPRVYIRQSDLTKHVKTHLTNPLPALPTTPPQRNVTDTQDYDITPITPELEISSISPKPEPVFSCHLCSRNFNAKRLLVHHVYAHLGIKPFSCSVCANKYSRKEDLVLHNRTHTGERPFSCDLCDRKFIRRRSYKLHRRTHSSGPLALEADNVVTLGEPEN